MVHNNALLDFETLDTIETSENDIIRNFMRGNQSMLNKNYFYVGFVSIVLCIVTYS